MRIVSEIVLVKDQGLQAIGQIQLCFMYNSISPFNLANIVEFRAEPIDSMLVLILIHGDASRPC